MTSLDDESPHAQQSPPAVWSPPTRSDLGSLLDAAFGNASGGDESLSEAS